MWTTFSLLALLDKLPLITFEAFSSSLNIRSLTHEPLLGGSLPWPVEDISRIWSNAFSKFPVEAEFGLFNELPVALSMLVLPLDSKFKAVECNTFRAITSLDSVRPAFEYLWCEWWCVWWWCFDFSFSFFSFFSFRFSFPPENMCRLLSLPPSAVSLRLRSSSFGSSLIAFNSSWPPPPCGTIGMSSGKIWVLINATKKNRKTV